MGSYLRKQVDGEDTVGPLPDYGPWPRRCMVCGQVHDEGECPIMLATERRLAEMARLRDIVLRQLSEVRRREAHGNERNI